MGARIDASRVERATAMLQYVYSTLSRDGPETAAASVADTIILIGELDAVWMTADREREQITAAYEARIAGLRAKNRELALTVSQQTMRIAELERSLAVALEDQK